MSTDIQNPSSASPKSDHDSPWKEALEADFRQALYTYEEQHHMPYVTTVEQAGIQKGEAKTLLRLLDQKFGPEAAQVHRERIETAELEQLDTWLGRILTAESPETIFD